MKLKSLVLTVVITIVLSAEILAQNVPNYVPTNGLIGWWPFNGNANDESGNGNDLNNTDGVSYSDDRKGNIGSSAFFKGGQKLVRDNPNFFRQNSDRTISFWIYQTKDITSTVSIININAGPGEEYCHTSSSIETYGNNNFYFWKRCDDLIWKTKEREKNSWYHVIVVYSQNIIKLYVNNELQEIKSFSSDPMNTIPTYFNVGGGMSFDGNNGFWEGKIDDIAIYNRALSDQEIKQLYGVTCPKETASSTSFSYPAFTTGNTISLDAKPEGGEFKSASVEKNQFIPSKAKIGVNKVVYTFINSQGCNDSTVFEMIVADTAGTNCKKYDTITITNNIIKYDTVKVTKYDTITIKNNVYDTVTVTKYDTITITNNVTKYDTITLTDTVSILKIKFKLTTGIYANKMISMSLYPNPTTDVLNIEVEDAKAFNGYRYRIFDAVGKEVYNELVKATKTEIPLKSLGAAGMYLFEVIDQKNKTIQSKKIVLE
jgi:Concanavalin A-like lectin/glucanases superfamily/Secretion system C-terminal sorting domain